MGLTGSSSDDLVVDRRALGGNMERGRELAVNVSGVTSEMAYGAGAASAAKVSEAGTDADTGRRGGSSGEAHAGPAGALDGRPTPAKLELEISLSECSALSSVMVEGFGEGGRASLPLPLGGLPLSWCFNLKG
jgi:hypothetical protein